MKLVIYYLIIIIGISTVHSASADVCSDISAIYDASKNKFEIWKGSYKPLFEMYEATHTLPNASGCYINWNSYWCEWVFTDEDSINNVYNSLVDHGKTCTMNGSKPYIKYDTEQEANTLTEYAHFSYPQTEECISITKSHIYHSDTNKTEYVLRFIFDINH
jgi:hypothetical protein